MIIRLSKSFSILARYVSKRPNSPYWQFCLRVPNDLRDRYTSPWIRQSLKTTDEREAIRAADKLVAIHEATFAAMRGNSNLTPAQTHMAAQALADTLGPMEVAHDYFADLFNAHATKLGFFGSGNAKKPGHLDPDLADEMIKETDYLDPVQQKALALIRAGNSQAPRLSAALTAYTTNHKNAGKKRAMEQAERDWGRLITVAGDIAITDLGREHARMYLAHCKANGLKTTSARRCVNSVNAILNFGIKELDIRGALNPFSDLSIPNEGKDAKKVKTPSPAELHEILEKFKDDTKDSGLIILLQMGLGTRVSEVVGVNLAVFNLDKELTTTLCAGYSTILRRRIVARWMELENAKAQPVALTPTQALLGIVQNMVDIERQQQALAAQAQAHTQALVEVTEKVQGLEDARLVPVHAKRPLARLSSSTNRILMLIVFAHKAYA